MNIILLNPEDIDLNQGAFISDERRINHIRTIHKAQIGDKMKLGLLNGAMGEGLITDIQSNKISFQLNLTQAAPQSLPLTLILALPRPKMLRRILQTVATLGVKNIYLINSYRVEKSYWQTPFLQEEAIRAQLTLGLEQGGDTHLPEVHLIKRFKPFVEDQLPAIANGSKALVAHPYTNEICPRSTSGAVTLAVGPEGGFIDYEIDMLAKAGFAAVHLGDRIMRVETAIPYLLARIF
jgi:16S rRNA (uracil1498-N3)-methyltransferase